MREETEDQRGRQASGEGQDQVDGVHGEILSVEPPSKPRTSEPASAPNYSSTNRYPTQGSVRMYSGDAGSRSSFFLSDAMSTRRCSG